MVGKMHRSRPEIGSTSVGSRAKGPSALADTLGSAEGETSEIGLGSHWRSVPLFLRLGPEGSCLKGSCRYERRGYIELSQRVPALSREPLRRSCQRAFLEP